MKEPEGHYQYDHDDYDTAEDICAKDGEVWPCPTWRKWLKSKDCRILQLESKVEQLESKVEQLALNTAGHRETLRQLDLFVRGGVARMVFDLAKDGHVRNSLDESVTREALDVHSIRGGGEVTLGRPEYEVIYKDNAGNTWRNNEWQGWETGP